MINASDRVGGQAALTLIVDDEQEMREELSFTFEKAGYHVITADSGSAAIDSYIKEKPELVILDIRMPNGSGIDFLRKVQSQSQVQSSQETSDSPPPVILCITGYSDLSMSEAFQLGADAQFKKPFAVDDLLSAANRFLAKRTEQISSEHMVQSYKDKLIEASKYQEIGIMSAHIAHEISNILAYINGVAELTKSAITKGNIDVQKAVHRLTGITNQCRQINQIIGGLQLISRHEKISSDHFIEAKVKSIVDDVLAVCTHRFENSSVQLIVPPVAEGLTLECNPTLLSQILVNLLNNAFDAVSSLDDKWCRLDVDRVENQIFIRVSDSGGGIPQELHEKIMKPFVTTKQHKMGTGLGLSIVNQIVEIHKGKFYINNESKHTCFVVCLPIAQP